MLRDIKTAALVGALAFGLPLTAHATITVAPNGGTPAYPLAETGGTFPLNISGYTQPSLVTLSPGSYVFTFTGRGDAVDNDTLAFTVGGSSFSFNTQTTPVGTSALVNVAASTLVSFTFTNATSGCSVTAGGAAGPSCSYLAAVTSSTAFPPSSTTGVVAYVGFADREVAICTTGCSPFPATTDPAGFADFQDGVVRIAQVPEPATLALLGAGVLGLGLGRRRRS